jgi:hypothetical protein
MVMGMADTRRAPRDQSVRPLLSTATAISIIKNGFAIDVHGLPAKVLAQYVWLRDTLFAPVVWALRYLGIEIEWWVKDVIMAYALVGAALARTIQMYHRKGWSWRMAFNTQDADMLLWPRTTWRIL